MAAGIATSYRPSCVYPGPAGPPQDGCDRGQVGATETPKGLEKREAEKPAGRRRTLESSCAKRKEEGTRSQMSAGDAT